MSKGAPAYAMARLSAPSGASGPVSTGSFQATAGHSGALAW